MVIDFRALNKKMIGNANILRNITKILDQLGSAKYFSVFNLRISSNTDTWVWCTKNSLFHSIRTLSFQLNPIRVKECVRHVPKIYGPDIIKETICSLKLMTSSFTRLPWPNTRQNLINMPNDYDRRILTYNQRNMSFCEKK